jgi:hypothetical protein
VGDFNLEQARGKSDKGYQVFLLGNGSDVLDDAIQNIVRECTRCQLVMLGQFYDVLGMPDYGLKLLFNGVGDF